MTDADGINHPPIPEPPPEDEPPRALVHQPTTTPRALILGEAIKVEEEQRRLLLEYVKRHMVPDVDFGVIPGTPKPSLWKPGAEKILDLYRCTADLRVERSTEDWEKPLFYYLFKCTILSRDTGATLAIGYGSCNSREGRYRWRDANRKCPKCAAETIFKSKKDEGFYCWAKKGGCGAQFGAKDPAIIGQTQGKVENDDVFTLVNTILKMAEKRAVVDATIRLARISDIFTQDVEDITDVNYSPPPPPGLPDLPPSHRDEPGRGAPPSSGQGAHASSAAGGGDLSNEDVADLIPLADTFVNARRLAEKAAAHRFSCLPAALERAITVATTRDQIVKLLHDFSIGKGNPIRDLAVKRAGELSAGRAA